MVQCFYTARPMFLHCPANVLHCMCMLALLYRQRKAVDVCAGACHVSAQLNHATAWMTASTMLASAKPAAAQTPLWHHRQRCSNPGHLPSTSAHPLVLPLAPPMLLRDAFQQVLWLVKVTSCRVRLTLQSARLEPSTSTAFCRIQHRRRGAAARRPRRAL